MVNRVENVARAVCVAVMVFIKGDYFLYRWSVYTRQLVCWNFAYHLWVFGVFSV